jgi:hypothetical protein
MKTFSYQRILPSCSLNRALLVNIEKRLRFGFPKLIQNGLRKVLQGLGLDDHQKFERFMVVVESKKESRILKCAKELSTPYFEQQPKFVKIFYDLGSTKFITVEVIFPRNDRPRVYLSTQSPQIEKLLPKIADGICAEIASHGNRHKILHNPVVQALILLTLPMMMMTYGVLSGIDIFLLYSSMGWLCLLSLGLVKSLPQLFPWVTFETKNYFKISRLPLLAKVSLLIVAVGCYIALVLLNMPHANSPEPVLLANLFG